MPAVAVSNKAAAKGVDAQVADAPAPPAHWADRALDSLTTGVILLDAAGHIDYVNPAAQDLLGTGACRTTGARWAEMAPRTGSLGTLAERALASARACTERAVRLGPPGGESTVDCTATPLAEGGVLLELTAVDWHLSMARTENLVSQQSAAGELLRGLAHEIKNPLGGLHGAAQLLARETADEGLREHTEVIRREVERLRALVDRLGQPRAPASGEAVDIHRVLEHVRRLTEAEAVAVEVTRDYDPSIPQLQGDRDALAQLFLNLTKNAIEAGARRLRLTTRIVRRCVIGAKPHRLAARIDVVDDGPGIPADLLPVIFYPMVSGRAQGTGLGLALAQSVARAHGGLITCDSVPGHTVLSVWLPLSEPDEAPETPP